MKMDYELPFISDLPRAAHSSSLVTHRVKQLKKAHP